MLLVSNFIHTTEKVKYLTAEHTYLVLFLPNVAAKLKTQLSAEQLSRDWQPERDLMAALWEVLTVQRYVCLKKVKDFQITFQNAKITLALLWGEMEKAFFLTWSSFKWTENGIKS